MFRNMIDRLLGTEPRSKTRTTRTLRIDRREAFLRAIEPPAVVQTWIESNNHANGSIDLSEALCFEKLNM